MLSSTVYKTLNEFADLMKIDRKLHRKFFLKGSPTQRSIDLVAIRATLFMKKKQLSGELKVGKKGKIKAKKKFDRLVTDFLKNEKYLPSFFTVESDKIQS